MTAGQVPPQGRINIDHIAQFVPSPVECNEALLRLGFTPTPFSIQEHRLSPDGPLTPAGSGNHCVMLHAGYLEFLAPLGDGGVAPQLRDAIARYVGVHSIVFGTAQPQIDHARLAAAGFAPLPPIALQRAVETPVGPRLARFTVVRVPAGMMPEGRMQFCRHHSESVVWQARWMAHPNRAEALRGVIVCVADPEEAGRRYGRFTGLAPSLATGRARIDTGRGWLLLLAPEPLHALFGLTPPVLPWIAGCVLGSEDLGHTRTLLTANGLMPVELTNRSLLVEAPVGVGGVFVFEARDAADWTAAR